MQEVSGVKMFLAVLVTLLVASGSYVVTNNLNNRTEDSEQEIDCTKQENISNENCIDANLPIVENSSALNEPLLAHVSITATNCASSFNPRTCVVIVSTRSTCSIITP